MMKEHKIEGTNLVYMVTRKLTVSRVHIRSRERVRLTDGCRHPVTIRKENANE